MKHLVGQFHMQLSEHQQFHGKSCLLSQQCRFLLQTVHFRRVGAAGYHEVLVENISCFAQIEEEETNQTNRASESQPPPVTRA